MAQASERPRRKRLSWESRCEIVAAIEAGLSPPLAAASGGCSRATAYRLWRRYQQGGWQALRDRRSTPHRQPRRLPAELEQRILAARRRTAYGPLRLSGLLPHAPSTIGKVLRRHGCSRLPRAERAPRCVRRYERAEPGELLHLDTKKLGRFWQPGKRVLADPARRNRGAGWQYLHVAIDDHSRYGDAELLPSERGEDCARFLEHSLARYRQRGITVTSVLTDNGAGYRSRAFAHVCTRHRIHHLRTRPYSPRTNGKAERFIQTLLAEWAYGRHYHSSQQRARTLWPYLRWYNRQRPHSSIGGRPPISRVSHLCGQDI